MDTMSDKQVAKESTSIMGKLQIKLLIGLVGMLIVIAGTLVSAGMTQKVLYLVGAVLMLTSAALERHSFLVILQIVIVSGTVVAFTSWPEFIKAMIPIMFSIIALLYFYFTHALEDWITRIGCAGLIAIALGFADSNPFIYLIGGVLLAIYGVGSYRRGVKIALLWAILNAIFALTSLVAIFRLVGKS
ncbi:MAG: hypothetical protein ACK4PR_13440 [Gammaproteobacteria bacterium]